MFALGDSDSGGIARGLQIVIRVSGAFVAALAIVSIGSQSAAQDMSSGGKSLPDSTSPFGPPPAAEPDDAPVTMPALAFTADGTEAANFDKYFAFHRDGTDYATAFADLVECDGYARGLESGINYQQPIYPYAGTIGGALGGALGSALADAIYGSAAKRRLRRVNMRACMNYKGYDRYGLPKAVWERFNFEEGLSSVRDEKRYVFLRQQAMVASSGRLQGKALGL